MKMEGIMVYSKIFITIIVMIVSVIVAYHQNKRIIKSDNTADYINFIVIVINTVVMIIINHVLLPELSDETFSLTIFTLNIVIPVSLAFNTFNLFIIFSKFMDKSEHTGIAALTFIAMFFIPGYIWYYIYTYQNIYTAIFFFYSGSIIGLLYLIQNKDDETSSWPWW